MVGDAETLPLEQDPSTIESQDQALDTSQTQEEPNDNDEDIRLNPEPISLPVESEIDIVVID